MRLKPEKSWRSLGWKAFAIGETLADAEQPIALPPIHVEEPTVRMTFGVNTAPMTGREGKWGTSRQSARTAVRRNQNNVALRVEDTESTETFIVSGRGELQLADFDRDHAPRRL